ncbi:MAG: porin family protein [Bacteroidota bacterium]
MKKTVLALVSALTILATSLQAQDMPLNFGIKVGLVNSGITNLGEVKKATLKDSKNSMFRPWVGTGLFAEYAFHDYVSAGLDVLYAGTGGKLTKEGDSNTAYSIDIHQLSTIPVLKVYPMGCEEDEGILSIHVGPEFTFPLTASAKEKEQDSKDIKEHLNSFRVGLFGGLGYEFPFGLLLELRGSYGLSDVFKKDSKLKTEELEIAADKSTNSWYTNLSLGYNFAKLIIE